jgi:hypothetical protein
VGVSLAMIDNDTTMVVVNLTAGLLEPEDVEPKAINGDEGAAVAAAAAGAGAALFSGSFGADDGELGRKEGEEHWEGEEDGEEGEEEEEGEAEEAPCPMTRMS